MLVIIMLQKENINWLKIQEENRNKIKTAKVGRKVVLNKNNKLKLLEEKHKEPKKKKNKSINVYQINKINAQATIEINYDKSSFSIYFNGARLLSINQIFHILQKPGYQKSIYGYKQLWQKIIQDKLKKLNKNPPPLFNKAVEITLFRQAPKLVDEDSLSTMFKYIIDALKKDHKAGFLGIISDDNKKIVRRIVLQQEKGSYAIGVKIKDISNEKFVTYSKEKLLSL